MPQIKIWIHFKHPLNQSESKEKDKVKILRQICIQNGVYSNSKEGLLEFGILLKIQFLIKVKRKFEINSG